MIGSSENRISYNGNGIATEFAYTFKILEKSNLKVLHVAADGTEQLLTKDYYVDMEKSVVLYPGYAPGAEIPESERPPILPIGDRLVLYREVPITQDSALDKHWPFNVIENGLDKLTIICQQIWDRLQRSFYVSESTSTNFDPKVPIEAGKTFRVKDDGTGFEVTEDPGKVIEGATALLKQTTEQAESANEAATNAQNAADAAEAVAPEYAKTKEVLDNIVSYTNAATEQASIATAKADAANASAINAAQSYANADAIAAQLTEYLATKETLTAPAVDKTLLIEGAAADSKVVGELDTRLSESITDILDVLKYSINVFEPSTISTGKFLRIDTGATPDIADWSVSDYIDMTGISKFATGYIKHVAFFDDTKKLISGSGLTLDTAKFNVVQVPQNARYMRFDWHVPTLTNYGYTEATIMIVANSDTIPSYFVAKGVPIEPTLNGGMKELNYWKGKRILWIGTSIPEGNRRPAYGYPNILGERLGCTVINNCVGGSMAMSGRQMLVSDTDPNGLVGQNWGWSKGFTQPLSLKEDFIANWDTWKTKFTNAPSILDETMKEMIRMSSYENALDPYLTDANKCDLYVINYGWNESTAELYSKDSANKLYCDWTYQYLADNASNIDTLDPYRYNTKTFRGAINWIVRRILAAQPQATILIIGEGEAAAHVNLVTAQEKCAYENALQYIPLWKCMGQNQRVITTNKRVNAQGEWVSESYTGTLQYCRIYDGTHPQGWMTNKIADYLEAKFRYEIRC